MELLSELRHQHIIRFLGASLEEEHMCIILELCSTSLFEVLHESQRRIQPDEMQRVLREVRQA